MRIIRLPVGLWLCLMLALMGCAFLPIIQPTPTPTVEIMADCFINFRLSAYEDADRDGVRDEGEPGLAGVEFILNGTFAYSFSGGRALTDADGQGAIDTWSPGGCQDFATEFSIDAVAPAGYAPSTDFPFDVEYDATSTQEYAFGFYPVEPPP